MSKLFMQVIICAVFLAGCKKDGEMTGDAARSNADAAMRGYCDKAAKGDCQDLVLIGGGESESGWLVEYKSDLYLYAVLVQRDGSTEISRTREQ